MPIIIAILIAFLGFGGVGGCMAIYPKYNVYTSRMAGQAQLAEAEGNRQIAVRAAMAKRDSAKMEADAEIIRAKGVAAANRIVAQGLGGPGGYLRYHSLARKRVVSGKRVAVRVALWERGSVQKKYSKRQ